jgi:D-glycero-alpha-D-manno-heptose-7-phosphate kinase
VHAENYGQSFWMNPEKPSRFPHPLLQHIIARMPVPEDLQLDIRLFSPVPAGISTGTSASVSVALLGALSFLRERRLELGEIVSLAHRIETEDLGQQSGIQDQICAAYGGICFIHMHRYPMAHVESVKLKPAVWNELSRRICLIYLGRPHLSSAVHEQVVARLGKNGPEWRTLERMKLLPARARAFLLEGDLESYGEVLKENNECQRSLFSRLISREADAVIAVAKKHGASGWKVNGAGGRGGSLTILANSNDGFKRKMLQAISALGKGIKPLPASLSATGLEAWEVE